MINIGENRVKKAKWVNKLRNVCKKRGGLRVQIGWVKKGGYMVKMGWKEIG